MIRVRFQVSFCEVVALILVNGLTARAQSRNPTAFPGTSNSQEISALNARTQVRFHRRAIKVSEVSSGEEVTAIYDNASRQEFAIGSVTRDTWKMVVEFRTLHGQLQGLMYTGAISAPSGVRADTYDVAPPRIVHGNRVLSLRIFIGSFSDWWNGLEMDGNGSMVRTMPGLRPLTV